MHKPHVITIDGSGILNNVNEKHATDLFLVVEVAEKRNEDKDHGVGGQKYDSGGFLLNFVPSQIAPFGSHVGRHKHCAEGSQVGACRQQASVYVYVDVEDILHASLKRVCDVAYTRRR